eukprot:Polyplicarium_translucidae@DN828_c0_g1_i2.p1
MGCRTADAHWMMAQKTFNAQKETRTSCDSDVTLPHADSQLPTPCTLLTTQARSPANLNVPISASADEFLKTTPPRFTLPKARRPYCIRFRVGGAECGPDTLGHDQPLPSLTTASRPSTPTPDSGEREEGQIEDERDTIDDEDVEFLHTESPSSPPPCLLCSRPNHVFYDCHRLDLKRRVYIIRALNRERRECLLPTDGALWRTAFLQQLGVHLETVKILPHHPGAQSAVPKSAGIAEKPGGIVLAVDSATQCDTAILGRHIRVKGLAWVVSSLENPGAPNRRAPPMAYHHGVPPHRGGR